MILENGIPLIDFSGVRARDPAAMRKVAGEIHEACTTLGFFYITNHQVPEAVIARAAQAARQFFACPLDAKRIVSANANHRGFHARGDALMYGAKRPDEKEFYSIGLELGGCGADLLRVIALSLGRDENFFAAKYTKPLQRTQIIYYPPAPPDRDPDEFGVSPHTDYGCITLLWQDDNGGLQVRSLASRTWIDARPIAGSFVVNVGDLLARWTSGRFSSTVHRVVNLSGRERHSIATFCDPDFATIIDPAELGDAAPQERYAPVRAGEYILGRFDQSFGYRKKLTAPH